MPRVRWVRPSRQVGGLLALHGGVQIRLVAARFKYSYVVPSYPPHEPVLAVGGAVQANDRREASDSCKLVIYDIFEALHQQAMLAGGALGLARLRYYGLVGSEPEKGECLAVHCVGPRGISGEA